MTARIWVLRIGVAAIITGAMMWGAVAWAYSNQPEPKTNTVEKVVQKTPAGCAQFVENADAFVSVTSNFLGVQNDAVEAIFSGDTKGLDHAVSQMEDLQNRYDSVMERYSSSRAGCLT